MPPWIGSSTGSTPSSTLTSAPSKETGSTPSPTADGVHLVNALNQTAEPVQRSGLAYYRDATNGNDGAQPDDYAVVTNGAYATWDNHNTTGRVWLQRGSGI